MERENSTRCISRFGNDFLNNAQWFFMDYLFLFNSLQLKVENYLIENILDGKSAVFLCICIILKNFA
jgi:hypothetical protein